VIVWRIEYNSGVDVLEFSLDEAESRRIVTVCPEDVQMYKSGLARVYTGPSTWRTIELSFRLVAGTINKIRTLAAFRGIVCIYYHYHVSTTDCIWAYVVPAKTEKYYAGFLLADNIMLEFIETTEPVSDAIAPGLLYFPYGGLYGSVG